MIKKRRSSGEIEAARNSSRIMIIIIIILIILMLGCIVYVGYLYQSGKIFQNENGDLMIQKDPVIKKKEDNMVSLDVDNTNIVSLFNIVKVSNSSCEDGSYSNQKKILVEDLSSKCLFDIAKNKYIESIQYDSIRNITYIPEDKVRDAYNSLYGNGKYQTQEVIPYVSMHDLMYQASQKNYFIEGRFEESDGSFQAFEKILSASRVENDLYITSAVLYYEKVQNVLCRDLRCESVIEQVEDGDEYFDHYFYLYLEHNKDLLYQYTYHFQLDESGFYHYIGYERTKE